MCVCVCVCVCVCMCGEHKPYTAIRRKCQRLLNASLRTDNTDLLCNKVLTCESIIEVMVIILAS